MGAWVQCCTDTREYRECIQPDHNGGLLNASCQGGCVEFKHFDVPLSAIYSFLDRAEPRRLKRGRDSPWQDSGVGSMMASCSSVTVGVMVSYVRAAIYTPSSSCSTMGGVPLVHW